MHVIKIKVFNKVICRSELRNKNCFRAVSAVHVPNNVFASKTQHVGEICTQWTRYLRPCEISVGGRSKALWSFTTNSYLFVLDVVWTPKGTITRDVLCQNDEYFIIIITKLQDTRACAVLHVGIACLRWRGKRSRHSRRMRTRNFPYLARDPCGWIWYPMMNRVSQATWNVIRCVVIPHGTYLPRSHWYMFAFLW